MRTLLALTLTLAPLAQAGLIKSDFQASGDGYLVTDTVTNLQWLSPYATRGETWNNSVVQGIEATYGFHYATYEQAYNMVVSNFGLQTTAALGDIAGFNAAQNYFNIFGKTLFGCGVQEGDEVRNVDCPRLQGLTADPGSYADSHLGLGMIQFDQTGWFIVNNSWPDNYGGDTQMGSWLVRGEQQAETPEPASVGLALAGSGMLLFLGRKRANFHLALRIFQRS